MLHCKTLSPNSDLSCVSNSYHVGEGVSSHLCKGRTQLTNRLAKYMYIYFNTYNDTTLQSAAVLTCFQTGQQPTSPLPNRTPGGKKAPVDAISSTRAAASSHRDERALTLHGVTELQEIPVQTNAALLPCVCVGLLQVPGH